MSKYIDLEPQIREFYRTELGTVRRAGTCDALRYLDNHPDQVPAKTTTDSEFEQATAGWSESYMHGYRDALDDHGITVIPDPEPTEAEKIAVALRETNHMHGSDLHDVKRLSEALAAHGVTVGDEA